MKALGNFLKNKSDQGQMLVIPYIMAGDHADGLDGLAETIAFLAENGASAIEIGIPFSDPAADGPVIEQAGIRALANGTTLKKVIDTLQTIETDIPLVIMSYINPIYKYSTVRTVFSTASLSQDCTSESQAESQNQYNKQIFFHTLSFF